MIAQNKPCYEYNFTKKNKVISDNHAGELPYAYGNLWRHPGLYSQEDDKLSEIMQQYWVNFVKTGDPNGEGLPRWEMRSADQSKLIKLDTNIEMVEDPNNAIYTIIDKYQQSERAKREAKAANQ